jgi:hypothetical protein
VAPTGEDGARTVAFPGLRAKLAEEWQAQGTHRAATDTVSDELVLHTGNDGSYAEIVGAMDAVYGVKRTCGREKECPAFRVVFAAN